VARVLAANRLAKRFLCASVLTNSFDVDSPGAKDFDLQEPWQMGQRQSTLGCSRTPGRRESNRPLCRLQETHPSRAQLSTRRYGFDS
jgi:hypothetical protein